MAAIRNKKSNLKFHYSLTLQLFHRLQKSNFELFIIFFGELVKIKSTSKLFINY